MTKDTPSDMATETLRRQAEDPLKEKPDKVIMEDMDAEAARQIHELHVHQMELEMQNEELLRTQKMQERQLILAVTDISDHERLLKSQRNEVQLKSIVRILQYQSPTVRDLLDYALNETVAITGSKIGYIFLCSVEENLLELYAWSKGVMRECSVDEPPTRYALDTAGIWGEPARRRKPLIVNNYQEDHPLKKGLPKGHVLIREYMTVPIFSQDKVVALVGLANKSGGFDETDLLQVTILMDAVWKEAERRRSQEALEARTHALGERVKELQCIYQISKVFQQDLSLPDLLKQAVQAIPPGWKYPDITCARIIFDGWEFQTESYRESPWTMTREIFMHGKVLGSLTVAYLEERPTRDDGPFLNEEWDLLHALAGHLGKAIERKTSEDELRRTTQVLDMFFSTSMDLLLILTPEGNVVRMNQEWEKTLGYSTQDLEGRNIESLIHPDDISYTLEARQRIAQGEIIRSFINRYLTKSGDFRIIEWRSVAAEGLLFAVGRDITERRQAEQHLFRQNELQRLLMHSAIKLINLPLEEQDPAIDKLLRVMGRFAEANRVCLFKYDLAQGQMTITHEWSDDANKRLADQFGTQRVQAMDIFEEWAARHKKGDHVHIPRMTDLAPCNPARVALEPTGVLSLLNVPLLSNTECLGFVCVQALREEKQWTDLDVMLLRIAAELLTNVTLRRRGELKVLQAYQDLKSTAATKEAFLVNTSHELRTPLNAVLGMSGLLLDTTQSREQRQYTENVHAAAMHLLSLVNDVLDFSKIEAGKMEVDDQPFELRRVLEETMEMLAPKAQEKGVELVCLIDAKVPAKISGDHRRVRQILTNLVGNAAKFTQHGEIVVRVGVCEDRLPPESNVTLRFTIDDTGIGIPADRLHTLFTPFTQADASVAGRFGGTGLGLYITKELIQLMNGEIGVSSRERQGSTFWFTLTFKAIPQPTAPRGERFLEGINVLVIDENLPSRQLLKSYLEAWGARYLGTSDPNTAMNLLTEAARRGESFLIVFINMTVQGLDGAALGMRIKIAQQPRTNHLIALLPLIHQAEAERFHQVGFSCCLSKPLRRDRVRNSLCRLVCTPGTDDQGIESGLSTFCMTTPRTRQFHILVAEDDPASLQLLLALLKRLDYAADGVVNGREALRALADKPYDLLILDCLMPELDGMETTRIIRKAENSASMKSSLPAGEEQNGSESAADAQFPFAFALHPDHVAPLPIIALTGRTMPDDREQFLLAGMDDHMAKPVFPGQLLEMLETWLN